MADAQRILEIVLRAKDEASSALKAFGDKSFELNKNVKTLATGMAALGATTSVFTLGIIKQAGEVEQTKIAFGTLLGDVQKADDLYAKLVETAKTTPFNLTDVTEYTKRLLAMGTAQEDLIPQFRMLGDIASGVGREKLPQLVLAFGQVQAKGRLTGEELRQFTETGIPLMDQLAQQFGVTKSKIQEMASEGEISFADVQTALQTMTSEGGLFFEMMNQQSQTTLGQWSNLQDSVQQLSASLGAVLLPAVNSIIQAMIPLVDQFKAWAEQHPETFKWLVIIGLAIGGIGTAMLVLMPIVSGLAGIVSILGGAISLTTTIIGGIVAIIGGPLTIAIGAIMLLVGLFALAWKNNWGGIQDKTKAVVDWMKNTAAPALQGWFNDLQDRVTKFVNGWTNKFNQAKDAVRGVIDAVGNLINKAKELASNVAGGLKIPGFQHGGFVPGGAGDAVPAILHGGERIVPRNGVDVNSGGGGASVNITFTGAISMDSKSRVDELARQIVDYMGRQNELAARGISI